MVMKRFRLFQVEWRGRDVSFKQICYHGGSLSSLQRRGKLCQEIINVLVHFQFDFPNCDVVKDHAKVVVNFPHVHHKGGFLSKLRFQHAYLII